MEWSWPHSGFQARVSALGKKMGDDCDFFQGWRWKKYQEQVGLKMVLIDDDAGDDGDDEDDGDVC